jgi:hypothetical protein
MTITHQASSACSGCGSWYRNKTRCNRCGIEVIEPEPEVICKKSIGIRSGGRLWSKKLGRYLTEKEIKSGMKGG